MEWITDKKSFRDLTHATNTMLGYLATQNQNLFGEVNF